MNNKRKRDHKTLKTLYRCPEETKSYWEEDWASRNYKKMTAYELYNHTFRATIDSFIENNQITDGQRVLDIGCGWGRVAIGLLKRFPTLKISGIDISKEAISRAPAIIESETGVSDVDLCVASAERLPFNDCTFDSVVSTRVFQYISDPQRAMLEVARVLKPKGIATVITPNKLNPIRYLFYHTRLLTTENLSNWMSGVDLKVISSGTIVFCPPKLLRFSEDSWWVSVDRILSKLPVIGKGGGLVVVSGEKQL